MFCLISNILTKTGNVSSYLTRTTTKLNNMNPLLIILLLVIFYFLYSMYKLKYVSKYRIYFYKKYGYTKYKKLPSYFIMVYSFKPLKDKFYLK